MKWPISVVAVKASGAPMMVSRGWEEFAQSRHRVPRCQCRWAGFIVHNGEQSSLMAKNQSSGGLWSPIHALTVLAEAGSFTAAAQRLNLSKAAMSQRVAELEQAAGVPLVQRTTRSMQLTDAGRQLVSATQGAFASIDQAFAEVRDLADMPSGRLRVTAPVALARQCIVPLLPGFLRAHPALQVELDLSDRLRPLAQEGFDLAIRHTSTPPDTHVAWMLRETRSLLLASPAYLAQRPALATPEDLRHHQCLHYPRPGD